MIMDPREMDEKVRDFWEIARSISWLRGVYGCYDMVMSMCDTFETIFIRQYLYDGENNCGDISVYFG